MTMEFVSAWQLIKASGQVLFRDKKLLVFPFLSISCSIIFLAYVFFDISNSSSQILSHLTGINTPWGSILYFYVVCLFTTFITVSFNTAIIHCVITRMNGSEPTIADGINAVINRLPYIAVWTLITGTIGLLLRILEIFAKKEESLFGTIIVAILGAFWSICTFLVIPVLVIERVNPFDAIKRSESVNDFETLTVRI